MVSHRPLLATYPVSLTLLYLIICAEMYKLWQLLFRLPTVGSRMLSVVWSHARSQVSRLPTLGIEPGRDKR
jgi:hypothetical protein